MSIVNPYGRGLRLLTDLGRLGLFLLATLGVWRIVLADAVVRTRYTEPLSVEDALNEREFGQLSPITCSPATDWVAYSVQNNRRMRSRGAAGYARTGVPLWGIGTDIFVSNVKTGEAKNLTGGKDDNWFPAWSPDGRYLAFLSDRDGSGQARLWVWDTRGSELRKVSDTNVRGNEIEWTPDSQRLLVTTLPEGLSPSEYARTLSLDAVGRNSVKDERDRSSAVVYSSFAHGRTTGPKSDPWNLDGNLRDLTSVRLSDGRATTIVRGERIASYSLSPDGSQVAFTIPRRFERPGSQQILFDIATAEMRGGRKRILASNVRLDYDGAAFTWSPGGSEIALHAGGIEEKTFDCYVADLPNGGLRNVTNFRSQPARRRKSSMPLWDLHGHIYFLRDGALWRTSADRRTAIEFSKPPDRRIVAIVRESKNLVWKPGNGESIIVVTHDDTGKQDGLYGVNLRTGESTELLEQGQCYTCINGDDPFAVTDDRRGVVYLAEDATRAGDLWLTDSSFKSTRRLTDLNPQFDKYSMGSARLVEWLSDDGELLHGTLLLPSGYEGGKRYPLIVWVYGGEALSNRFDRFGTAGSGPFNMQLFATRGYAVLLPDAPQHLGTPMFDLSKTVLPAVNKIVDEGIADPQRIGVVGHSYGGYSALSLIVQTERFKAAMEIDGMGDLLGAYGAMDESGAAFGTSIAEEGQGLMGGTPWQFRSRYIENSPVFYLDRVETPLLIVQGAADHSVPSFLADQIFVDMRRLGKEVEYAKYLGEGHAPPEWSYGNQVDFCSRMIAWFDGHLEGRTS